jgi:hypothetical protein
MCITCWCVQPTKVLQEQHTNMDFLTKIVMTINTYGLILGGPVNWENKTSDLPNAPEKIAELFQSNRHIFVGRLLPTSPSNKQQFYNTIAILDKYVERMFYITRFNENTFLGMIAGEVVKEAFANSRVWCWFIMRINCSSGCIEYAFPGDNEQVVKTTKALVHKYKSSFSMLIEGTDKDRKNGNGRIIVLRHKGAIQAVKSTDVYSVAKTMSGEMLEKLK